MWLFINEKKQTQVLVILGLTSQPGTEESLGGEKNNKYDEQMFAVHVMLESVQYYWLKRKKKVKLVERGQSTGLGNGEQDCILVRGLASMFWKDDI